MSNFVPIPEDEQWDANTIPSMEEINGMKKRWTAASLFAGCGGASTGLKLAGYSVRYASEFVPSAADCYERNRSRSTYLDRRDIREVSVADFLSRARVDVGELDLLDGSPPCKALSIAVRHKRFEKAADEPVRYSDNVKQRVDDLFSQYVRILRGAKPKMFMAENVPGLLMSVNKGMFLDVVSDFQRSGYRVKASLIDPTLLGVPQRRVRLVFVGVRDDLELDPVLPLPRSGRVLGVRDVVPYIKSVHNPQTSAGHFKSPRDFWLDARMPCPVMVASAHSFDERNNMGASGYVRLDDGTPRKFSIPELKAVFGFPHDFVLTGTFAQRWERLGRSHVPLAVYAISRTLGMNVLDRIREV